MIKSILFIFLMVILNFSTILEHQNNHMLIPTLIHFHHIFSFNPEFFHHSRTAMQRFEDAYSNTFLEYFHSNPEFFPHSRTFI